MLAHSLFTKNRWQKAVALCLATMIWLTVHSGNGDAQDDKREFSSMRVAVLTSAMDKGIYRLTPDSVQITVQGESSRLQALNPEDIEVFVNLLRGEPFDGPQSIHVHVPNGFRVGGPPVFVKIERLPLGESVH